MTGLQSSTFGARTLAAHLSEGRVPVPDALRYATLLGEELRKIHGRGEVHGDVSPESIMLNGAGLELVPAAGTSDTRTPSTDIFAFGAVLHEMLTGRRIAEGVTPVAPEPTGMPVADRLLAYCLADEPAARPPNMQRVLLELKLVALAARSGDVSASMRREAADLALRTAMQEMEARLAARQEAHEKKVAEEQQAANDAVQKLSAEFAALQTELLAVREGMEANAGRLTALEQRVDAVNPSIASLGTHLTEDIYKLEKSIQVQTAVIESVRTSIGQTDGLVERVVEAMEMLQDSILQRPSRLFLGTD
jgi:serine/threonine protein kinase